jgi:prophage maintenance system killer protein
MKVITLADIEYIIFELARTHLSFSEPIPDFSTRYPNILESCIMTPFQSFGRKDLYPSLIGKASILFYLMVKNHPFHNGNKRIAITTLLTFLYENGKWITVDSQGLYNFTVWVAQSPPEVREHVLAAIQQFIKKHLTKID